MGAQESSDRCRGTVTPIRCWVHYLGLQNGQNSVEGTCQELEHLLQVHLERCLCSAALRLERHIDDSIVLVTHNITYTLHANGQLRWKLRSGYELTEKSTIAQTFSFS